MSESVNEPASGSTSGSTSGLVARGLAVGWEGPVLQGLDFALPPGGFVALLGPNGAGKSTLLRALAGLKAPLAGEVRLDGALVAGPPAGSAAGSAAGLKPRALARLRAYLAQVPTDEPGWRVREIVAMGRFAHPDRRGDARAIARAMALAGVADLADRPVMALSGGQRQRVHLARALAQEAPWLFLDEPTAHLDLTHQLAFHETVRRVAREDGVTVVAVLHDLNLASQFADRLLVVAPGVGGEPGGLVADGPPGAVLTEALVARAFGLAVRVHAHPETGRPYVLPLAGAPAREPARSGRLRTLGLERLHVVAGGGAGERLLPAIARLGYAVSVGAVNMLDSDQATAARLGLDVVTEAPFSPIGPAARAALDGRLADAATVVVADVAWGVGNVENLRAVLARLDAPAPPRVYLVAGDAADFTGGEATRLRRALMERGAEALDPDALLARLAAD